MLAFIFRISDSGCFFDGILDKWEQATPNLVMVIGQDIDPRLQLEILTTFDSEVYCMRFTFVLYPGDCIIADAFFDSLIQTVSEIRDKGQRVH